MSTIERYVGVHNALGAKIAERAGFEGIWLSGLEISASQCVPDADLITLTQQLEILRPVIRATSLPILVDCDAGYGNSTNARLAARYHYEAGAAGVCIEDKPFPKMNSFVNRRQSILDPRDFAAKISAARDAVDEPAFQVVARTEALVVGESVESALTRAEIYRKAGADAILVHDRSKSDESIRDFAQRWAYDTPLIAVPTTYYSTTASQLRSYGYARVIYANHGLRAAIRAVESVFGRIIRDGGTHAVEPDIAGIEDIFDLQELDELHRLEERAKRKVRELR
ncbi:isocitrate lyase/phosphoenolpyruvate mutase family protein [Nocardia sp. BMG51109]|uniref:isocitrate lyase/phosphoenolpyruvate mutase family protein n=1 Tax=Nocardia sp. BMG51109 TaxID=1056816 RepID=UPI0004B35629|nr:isocitrate lyase/phosphoenolpyruvate mutase family protein [Nocardia sp. BMG51109]